MNRKLSSREKVRTYRERMRARGLRPVQIWVPDTRTAGFVAEAHRQSLAVASSAREREDQAFVDSITDRDQA
ncbi:MAG: antitoxin MazE family protein [Rhodospirillales bacterium]